MPTTTLLSCPNCGARAAARSKVCADCGYPFVEDSSGARHGSAAIRVDRRRVRVVALAAAVVAAAGLTAWVAVRGARETGDASLDRTSAPPADRPRAQVLSRHPQSARAAERRLVARVTSPRDDDSAAARCSALQPRPAHAIRYCRVRYPGGTERTVVVLSNPQGHELLVEP